MTICHLIYCLIIVNIKEGTQMKTPLKYQFTSVKRAILKKSEKKCYKECRGEKRSSHRLLVWVQVNIAIRDSVWRCIKILKIKLPYDFTIPLQGINPENSIHYHSNIFTFIFIDALLTRAKQWNKHSCSLIREWMK